MDEFGNSPRETFLLDILNTQQRLDTLAFIRVTKQCMKDNCYVVLHIMYHVTVYVV